MTTLLLAEHDNKALAATVAKAMTAARALGEDVDVLVAGADCKAVAEAAAKLEGAAKVLYADAPQFAHQLAEEIAALILGLMPHYNAVVAPSTASGKNIMPRVAALLDVMQISDIIKVVAADTFERPIYAGNAIQTVQATDAKKVVTFRPAAFKAATTKPPEPIPAKPSLPNAKEQVTLRIDRDVLDHFQGGGPGWQDRINQALRKAAGL